MPRKRLILLSTIAAAVLLVPVTIARAAPTLALSTGPDPAESIVTQLIATGEATNSQTHLSMTVKATGGQGCGANRQADGGSAVIYEESVKEASFHNQVNHEFQNAGSYLICAWLTDSAQSGSPVVATASITVAVRPPHLALSVGAPATVAVSQTFQIVTSAQAEVARPVTEYVVPNTSRGCPANASAAEHASGVRQVDFSAKGLSWSVAGGPFTESANFTLYSAGQYLVCAYVEYPAGDSPPEIAASAPLAAVAPPPPCIVPSYSSVTKLRDAESAIHASGCAVGRVRRVASRRVRSGYVISLGASSGTHLSPGAAVNITVSTGPPCIVPFVAPGTSLGRVEARLVANHCAVGKISSARSRRVRRGRVLRLGARTGQALASHAPVAIVIARRRR